MRIHTNSQSALAGGWPGFLKKSFNCLSRNTILNDDKTMQSGNVFTFILLFGLSIPSLSFAEPVAEERMDNKWVVNFITKNSVHATVNGQVTHGDGLHIRLVKNHCNKGNLLTFVYTPSNHPEIQQLKDSYVTTKFMGGEMIVKVVYVSPFLMGHRATIDMGWAEIDKLKEVLSKENPLVIEYRDSKKVRITDYFDITQNSWSNDGVSDALDRAMEMCRNL